MLGSQEITAEVEVMLLAFTQEGPSGASLPMIIVQAASLEVRLLMVTDLTLIRCGCEEIELQAENTGGQTYLGAVHTLHQSPGLV